MLSLDDPDDLLAAVEAELDLVEEEPTDSSPVNTAAYEVLGVLVPSCDAVGVEDIVNAEGWRRATAAGVVGTDTVPARVGRPDSLRGTLCRLKRAQRKSTKDTDNFLVTVGDDWLNTQID
jgi:hypothetical protein